MSYDYKIQKDELVLKSYKGSIKVNDSEVDKILHSYQSKVKIDGFRPGKVPFEKLKEMYYNNAYFDFLQNELNNIIKDIMKEKNYKLCSSPRFEPKKQIVPGSNVDYSLHFDLHLELKDLNLSKISATYFEPEISNQDIDVELKKTVKPKLEKIVVDDKKYSSKSGDVVNIDFEGFVDNVAFEGGKAEGYDLELGSGSFIPGFEDQLIGKKTNDNVSVKVTFPVGYQKAELSGKPSVFKVKINSIKTYKEREVNDELAKELKFESAQALKDQVVKSVNRVNNLKCSNLFRNEVNKEICSLSVLSVSDTLIEQKTAERVEEMKKQNIFNEKDSKKIMSGLKEDFEKHYKLSYVFEYLIKKFDIKLENQDIKDYLIKELGLDPEKDGDSKLIESYMSNKNLMSSFQSSILEDKVYKVLESNISLKRKKISVAKIDELLKKI